MKIPWRILLILGTALIAWYLFAGRTTEVVSQGGQSEVKISAEEIKRIMEVAAASQKVVVTTDTMYITKTVKQLLGIQLKFGTHVWESTEQHRLKERRTWLLKAGSTDFDLKKTEHGYQLTLDAPQILTKEHIAEDYQELERVGIWNPVLLQKIEIASRERAVATAIKAGLLTEARLSLETSLLKILPTNVKIKINE